MPRAVGFLKGTVDSPCVEGKPCILKIGSLQLPTSAFAYYIIAISVLLQALVFISVGAMADYGGWRKRMLFISTIVGSASSMLILTVVRPSLYLYAALLSIVMNIAFGTATVFYNAYLPLLANNYHATEDIDPDMVEKKAVSIRSISSENTRLKKHDNISSFISTRGFILGYLGAFIVLALCAVYVYLSGQTFLNLEMCVAFCGVWWLLFSIYSFLRIKKRPGPDLPTGTNYLLFSWKKVYRTMSKCKQLPVTFWYLLCFFLFSDGYSTVGSVAVIFAHTEMGVPYDKLIIAVLLSPFCSFLGNAFFYILQKWTKLASKSILVILLGLMGLIPIWGILGFFTTSIGLHNQWEIYLFACYFGFLVGALQSFSRVIFSELIPPGDESEFFSLYAITDKGSSWLGPLVQSLLLNVTGSPRYIFIVLLGMIWIPIPIIVSLVDMTQGIKDAKSFHLSDSTLPIVPVNN